MRNALASLALAVLLIGCGKAQETASPPMAASGGYAVASRGVADGRTEEAADTAAPADAPAPPPPAPAGEQVAQAPQQTPPGNGGTNSPVLYLAYAYQVSFELPADHLSDVVNAHVQACQAAGPRLCQLVGSGVSGDPQSYMQGTVSIRAEPNWLRTFMASLDRQADAAGGRVTGRNVSSEDLTRQIVDTEAHLRAQTALRDRLQRLLESRPGRLSDLLDVERELARVQGEIDATQSNLAVMRTRVSMSELTLTYQSAPRSVGSDTFKPLRDAFAGFIGIVVVGFAAIITIIAGLIPFAVVIIPVIWGLLVWRRRRGGRFFNRKTPPPPPPADA